MTVILRACYVCRRCEKSCPGVNPKTKNSIAVRTAELCGRYRPYSHQGRCGQVIGPLSPSVVEAGGGGGGGGAKRGSRVRGKGVEPSSEQWTGSQRSPYFKRPSLSSLSQALLSSLAQGDLANPLRLEYLRGREAPVGMRIKDRVYNISTSCLRVRVRHYKSSAGDRMGNTYP